MDNNKYFIYFNKYYNKNKKDVDIINKIEKYFDNEINKKDSYEIIELTEFINFIGYIYNDEKIDNSLVIKLYFTILNNFKTNIKTKNINISGIKINDLDVYKYNDYNSLETNYNYYLLYLKYLISIDELKDNLINFIKYLNDTLSSSKILHAIYKVSYSVIGYKVKFKITCTDNGMSSSGEITRVVLEAKDKNEGKNACLGFFGYNTFEDVQKMGKGESSFYIESEKYIQLMVTTNVMFENFSVCTALHEFCHVLGVAHTHQVDNENPIKVEDWIVDELLKNFQNVEDVYQQIVLRDVNPIHQKFDTLSIMTYDIQSDWNRLGLSISSNFFLSESDKNSLKLMYPEVVEEKYIVYDPLIRSSTYYTPYTSTVSGITMIIIMILITIIYFRR